MTAIIIEEISLLNTGCKIFSAIIKNKLNRYENILGEEQNGFRKGRSCCDGYFTMKLLTLLMPRAWDICYMQPFINCQGKSATHLVYI